MARIIIALLIVSLTIYALIDCARTPASDIPARISKPAWLVLIVLLPVIGPSLWLYFAYRNTLSSDAPMSATDFAGMLRGKKNASSGPIAPDDDPEFLARLDAVNRRKAYEQRKAQKDKKSGHSPKKPHGDDPDSDEPKGLYS
ncbi:MAG: PLD nuclease N-terminal domain-containing protein [Actinomycetaceae bacterium]|nr:PLD nuclease N-terminal domain-containing protein [Arcanobacterium sp.]MDD7686984.1 PLD nuclease N-terminal domain-containing protein [Actinomycetaceae bacterium]MDY5273361.1 PLD nuclease N-terminal domain-containing protein [Arcanobacterium sp.]